MGTCLVAALTKFHITTSQRKKLLVYTTEIGGEMKRKNAAIAVRCLDQKSKEGTEQEGFLFVVNECLIN